LNSKLMMSFVSETSPAKSAPHWALNWRRLTEKTKLMKYCGGRWQGNERKTMSTRLSLMS
jgi:hypothetical protein